ncbi:MAG: twin-arginine translocase subunit TatC [Cyanobacteria bacterium REEB67]|nr:twin-arginine translocase subunit TatC [Cyanobacteria bacterium REEB67]
MDNVHITDEQSLEVSRLTDGDKNERDFQAITTVDDSADGIAGAQSVSLDEGDGHGHTMTVVEHLDELRTRLLRSIAYVFVAFVTALFFTKDVLRFLEAPAGGITFQALSLEEPLIVFFKVAFYLSLIAASPLLLFEISRFVSPGLTRKERKVLAPLVVGGPILFVCGALFAYYFLLPPMLHFFSSFGQGVTPINQRLDFYISLVSSILLYMGLCFQMPIIIFALAMAGVVTSGMLIKVWRFAIFGTALVACVITPDPTAFSMLLVMAALNGLYILSIIMLKLARK